MRTEGRLEVYWQNRRLSFGVSELSGGFITQEFRGSPNQALQVGDFLMQNIMSDFTALLAHFD